MLKRRVRALARIGTALFATLAIGVPSTPAGTTTKRANGSFDIAVSVHAVCSITATDMIVDAAAASRSDGAATVTVTCDSGTPYNVGLGVVTFTRAPGGIRTDPEAGLAGGRALSGPDTVPVTGSGRPQTIIVRGRMPAAQPDNPGDNADVIAVTISY